MLRSPAEVLRSVAGKSYREAFGREPTAREMDVIAAHRLAGEALRMARSGSTVLYVKPSLRAYHDAQEIAATADRELAALIVRAEELTVARRQVRAAIRKVRARQDGYLYGRAFEDQACAAGLDRALLAYRFVQSIEPARVAL